MREAYFVLPFLHNLLYTIDIQIIKRAKSNSHKGKLLRTYYSLLYRALSNVQFSISDIHGKIYLDLVLILLVIIFQGLKMIKVDLRDKNQIVTLTTPGKIPIQGRTGGSPFFHNSIDLLLSALGLCIGGKIVEYCRFNDLNVQIFEAIACAHEKNWWEIWISKPKDLDEKHVSRLENQLKNCTVGKELINPVKVIWSDNESPIEELLKETKTKCCGGKR